MALSSKELRKRLTENPDVTDIDGKPLAVGDNVLYVNSRYGSGTELCHGQIVRFAAKISHYGNEVFTVVKEDGKEVESKIRYPASYIFKK